MKVREPVTVYVSWGELLGLLEQYGVSRWEALRLRDAGVIPVLQLPAGMRPKYDWQGVLRRLEFVDAD